MKQSKIFRTVFSVTGLILFSKMLGFVKQMLTASAFGATIETDLINLSEGFVGNLQYLLVQTMLTSFIAVYIYVKKESEADAKAFATNVLKVFTLLGAGVSLFIALLSPWIAKIIAPSYDADLSFRLSAYIRLFSPMIVCFIWIAVFHAALDSNKRFFPGQMEGLNQSVILIVLLWLFADRWEEKVLVVAFFAYNIWNAGFLGALARPYFGRSRGNAFRDPEVKKLLRMMAPLLVGYSLVYVNQLVDKALVSGLQEGTVTALNYAAVLSNLVGTIIVSVAAILFPYITTSITKGETEKTAHALAYSALLMLVAILPVSILVAVCSQDVVSVVYGRGAFLQESVRVAGAALRGYSIGFVPLVLREVFSRFQYAYQDSKHPMINSSVSIGLNIVLSVVLCPIWGVLGVTVASSVSVLLCGILNARGAKRHNAALDYKPFLSELPWLCLGGVGCFAASIWLQRLFVQHAAWMRLLLCALGGLAIYLLAVAPVLWRCWKKRTTSLP